MKEFRFVVRDPQGIHARPAGMLVKEASGFESKITIGRAGTDVDAKRILGIMGLGAKQGEEIVIKAEGSDEDAAIGALRAFLEKNMVTIHGPGSRSS